MANNVIDLTTIPLEDNFKTSLSQSWAGWTWTMYVASTPSFTFPSGQTTYVVVNPWKSNMQIAEINAYDWTAKTLTVSNVTLEKWASVNSTAQTHNVWSEVVISDNYQVWADILDAVNSKVAQSTWQVTAYADATARDAAITAPANWMQVYLTTEWKFTDYVWGSWQDRASWTNPNASETVAGRVEIATSAETQAWTDTGWTWAKLAAVPSEIWKAVQNQSYIYDEDTWAANAYVVTLSPVPTAYTEWMKISVKIGVWNTNTWASTINVNSLWAKDIQDKDWDALWANQLIAAQVYDLIYDGTQFRLITVEKASDTEFKAATDEQKYITSAQAWYSIVSWDQFLASWTTNETTGSTTYVKMKEIEVDLWWTYKITNTLRNFDWVGWTNVYSRIYVNWIAVWTERSTTNTSFQTYEEDITLSDWDLVQLYLKKTAAWDDAVTNLLQVSYWIKPILVWATVNDT